MVTMDFPAASLTESWQERRGVPFSKMVHAPHWPSPQPYLVPVRPSSSRNAESNEVAGSDSKNRLFPLICAWIDTADGPLMKREQRAATRILFAPARTRKRDPEIRAPPLTTSRGGRPR